MHGCPTGSLSALSSPQQLFQLAVRGSTSVQAQNASAGLWETLHTYTVALCRASLVVAGRDIVQPLLDT
jgi:hypothetical protein